AAHRAPAAPTPTGRPPDPAPSAPKDAEGGTLGGATPTDPATGDEVDAWADGETIVWHGTIGGEPVEGSATTIDFDPQATLICLTPVTAILCLGAVILLFGSSCSGNIAGPCPVDPVDPSSGIPGGAGGVPDDGGDGDGDSGDDGKTGGGDED